MAVGTSSFIPKDVNIQGATDCKISNIILDDSGVEYSILLQSNLRTLRIRSRGGASLQYTFTEFESGTKYFTVYKGTVDEIQNISFTGKILYIQSNQDNTLVEIAEFYST